MLNSSQSSNEFSALGGLVLVTLKMESIEEWQENINELSKESEYSEATAAETLNRVSGESATSVVNALNVQDSTFLVNLMKEIPLYLRYTKMEVWRRNFRRFVCTW